METAVGCSLPPQSGCSPVEQAGRMARKRSYGQATSSSTVTVPSWKLLTYILLPHSAMP